MATSVLRAAYAPRVPCFQTICCHLVICCQKKSSLGGKSVLRQSDESISNESRDEVSINTFKDGGETSGSCFELSRAV